MAAEGERILRVIDPNDPNVLAGFSTRWGGHSQGLFSSFNLAHPSRTSDPNLKENWELFQRTIIGANCRLAILKQAHGTSVATATSSGVDLEEADAIVTEEPNVCVGVFTADCLPILVYDNSRRIVGAVHAGWRPLSAGILESVDRRLRQMRSGLQNCRVWIGPAVKDCCYEVDEPVWSAFKNLSNAAAAFRPTGRSGKWWLDLQRAARAELGCLGVSDAKIETIRACTFCDVDRFFSYRRAQRDSSGVTGSHFNFILRRGS